MALCGHATLACAHHLWQTGRLAPDRPAEFDTWSGRLTARRHDEAIVLDFPAVPATRIEPPPSLGQALSGLTPLWTGITEANDLGERNVLAVVPDEDAVRALVPDLRAVEQLPAGGLIVTAPGTGGDVVSRYFAPAYGIPRTRSPAPRTARSDRTGAPSGEATARTPIVGSGWPPARHHHRLVPEQRCLLAIAVYPLLHVAGDASLLGCFEVGLHPQDGVEEASQLAPRRTGALDEEPPRTGKDLDRAGSSTLVPRGRAVADGPTS